MAVTTESGMSPPIFKTNNHMLHDHKNKESAAMCVDSNPIIFTILQVIDQDRFTQRQI